MIRVLHFSDPEQARRRIAFHGVAEAEADRFVSVLRAFLLSVPSRDEVHQTLPALLGRRNIPYVRGRDVLLLSVSSIGQLDRATEDGSVPGDLLDHMKEALVRYQTREYTLLCRERSLRLSGEPRIMGILNVTPDSFSDGGKYLPFERAVEHGRQMAGEGADIIDVGGESTRPGSIPVPADVEIARVIPVIRALAESTDAILSIDTTKAKVARQAVAAGAQVINDTSALVDDPEMADVVRDSGCAVVLMHRLGTPETMQRSPSYRSLFDEILDALAERVVTAETAGIKENRILVDPGIGFGKRLMHNLALHRHIADLRNLGKPILFGASRKSFLGTLTERGPGKRACGTSASVAVTVLGGAHIVRVHDVKEARDAVRVAAAVSGGAEC